ncbi:hypothetical protein K3495_g6118 [Podosphaera aphanis]|nr:hypothetical protein K3495_g6118 [Podosphaera aphanis]
MNGKRHSERVSEPTNGSSPHLVSHERPQLLNTGLIVCWEIFSSEDLTDHWVKLNLVLQRLADAGLKLDRKKCEFSTKKTKYSGFIIEAEKGLSPDPEKIRAIVEWQSPKDVNGFEVF